MKNLFSDTLKMFTGCLIFGLGIAGILLGLVLIFTDHAAGGIVIGLIGLFVFLFGISLIMRGARH